MLKKNFKKIKTNEIYKNVCSIKHYLEIFKIQLLFPNFFPYFTCPFWIFFNVYLFLRERDGVSRGGAEKEGDTESEAGFRLGAVSAEPNAGLEPTDGEIMTWAKVGCSTDWAAQLPLYMTILLYLGVVPRFF